MLGIAVELLLSFLLLHYLAPGDVGTLGLWPSRRRFGQLLVGIIIPVMFLCLFNFSVSLLVRNPYRVNAEYGTMDFWLSVGYVIRSVAFEELLFRGALLWLLMYHFGTMRAIAASAIVFGCYHWFAWNAFGNPIAMGIIFLSTASMGYIFALAYSLTRSMYLGFGLHLGNNIASMLIFSKDSSIGPQWLEKSFTNDPVVPGALISIPVIILHYLGMQLVCYAVVRMVSHLSKSATNNQKVVPGSLQGLQD